MAKQKASVVVPTRNRADLLLTCLDALSRQDIDLQSFEVLVCDDGSAEDILSAVQPVLNRGMNIRILRQPPKGPAAARNLGINNSSAPIIIFVDSDTVPERSMIKRLMESLESQPNWLGAEAMIEPIGGDEGLLWDAPSCDKGGRFHTAAIAFRREALIEAGGLDQEFKLPACEDVELAMRILPYGAIGFVPEAVTYHPRRPITLKSHWYWRKRWRYVVILAKRYGILAFPEKTAGRFPRLRVAIAAVITLPVGRFLAGLKYLTHDPTEGLLACGYALFDIFCGAVALPMILFDRVPERKNYVDKGKP